MNVLRYMRMWLVLRFKEWRCQLFHEKKRETFLFGGTFYVEQTLNWCKRCNWGKVIEIKEHK